MQKSEILINPAYIRIPMSDKTMVRLSREVVEELKRIGKKGESYDDVLRRILHMEERGGE